VKTLKKIAKAVKVAVVITGKLAAAGVLEIKELAVIAQIVDVIIDALEGRPIDGTKYPDLQVLPGPPQSNPSWRDPDN
jgi:hypothetical protein